MLSKVSKSILSVSIIFSTIYFQTESVNAESLAKKAIKWLGGVIVGELITSGAKAGASALASPKIVLDSVELEYNIYFEGQLGIFVKPSFRVYGLRNYTCEVVAAPYLNGKQLVNRDAYYGTVDGHVAFPSEKFIPEYDATQYENAKFFIPISQFDLPSGKYNLKLDIFARTKDGKVESNSVYKYITME